MSKNVFVLGLDEQNLETLHDVPRLAEYRFHPLLSVPELQEGSIPIEDLIEKANAQLDGFEGTVDAIVGYWDFPVSTMLPILCGPRGLPSAKLEAVLKCEHKYWSRLVQDEVSDEHPNFAVVDTDAEKPPEGLRWPMWVKPVKSFSSDLAFKVDGEQEFRDALTRIRDGIGRVGEPFQYILDQADLPPEIADIGAQAVLVEEAMSGQQAAVEGYSFNGKVTIYGALDSVNYEGTPSFKRHQYPSQLPERTVQHMTEISKRVIEHIGLDNTAFSIEFFCQPEEDEVCVLEINPRHSQSHAEMFDHVDGAPNHHCMLRLALGEEPEMPYRQGEYAIAAKYYHRRFEGDALVTRVPTAEEIEAVERDLDGVGVEIVPKEGQRLSDMEGQDSYSYELAHLFVAGSDVDDIERKFSEATGRLRFEFEEG